jgi:hypothetical protein
MPATAIASTERRVDLRRRAHTRATAHAAAMLKMGNTGKMKRSCDIQFWREQPHVQTICCWCCMSHDTSPCRVRWDGTRAGAGFYLRRVYQCLQRIPLCGLAQRRQRPPLLQLPHGRGRGAPTRPQLRTEVALQAGHAAELR